MTIREMETATGLTRANIRFYENQGLLNVERKENNYREYTLEHVQLLLRVKLLRALGMGIEEIRALQSGQEDMTAALDRQIRVLEKQMMALKQSRQVCHQMRADGVCFDTLDAGHYLDLLNRQNVSLQSVLYRDAEPRILVPWQRFWARSLDAMFCSQLVILYWAWRTGGILPDNRLAVGFFATVLGLILEPVCLWRFGTTLGKWIFGLRVEYPQGGRLRLSDSFRRRLNVLIYGQGLQIPGAELWRLWKSYRSYDSGEVLPWEELGEIAVRDTRPWRYGAAALTALGVFLLTVTGSTLTLLPENRGDLTVQQFCENYREMARQNGIGSGAYVLADNGTWRHEPEPNTVYIELGANTGHLDFVFITDSGAVTSVTISEEITGEQEQWIDARSTQMQLMSMAFLTAREDYNIFASEEKEILSLISDCPFEDFTVTVCGLEFTYDVEFTGYHPGSAGGSSVLIDDGDPETDAAYAMTFTVKKVG